MAWNRASGEPDRRSIQKRKGFRFPAVLVGVIAVIGMAIAWFVLSSSDDAVQDAASKKRTRVKEVAPAKAPTNAPFAMEEVVKPAKRKGNRDYWLDKLYTDTNGVVRYPGGARYMGPNDKIHHDTTPIPPPRFKHHTSEIIATLLEIVPGEIPVGGIDFPRDFNKRFIESLKEPVAINDDDSDYMKELKKSVEDAKQNLAKRMANGEDPKKVCEDTWEELKQVGLYRDSMMQQVYELRQNPDFTERDLNDLVNAANEMLKEKGSTGLGISPTQIRRLMQRDARRRARELK